MKAIFFVVFFEMTETNAAKKKHFFLLARLILFLRGEEEKIELLSIFRVEQSVQSLSNDSLFLRPVGTMNGGIPGMSSSGGHVPSSPSPPGHDPRTSSIQALRMRAKEHVESITKGLQMVWTPMTLDPGSGR